MYSSNHSTIDMMHNNMDRRDSHHSVKNLVNFAQLKIEEDRCMATLVDPKYPKVLDPKKFEWVLRRFDQRCDYNIYTECWLNRFDDDLSALLRCLTKLEIPENYIERYTILREFLMQDRGRCEDETECYGICVDVRSVDGLEYFLEKADNESRAKNMATMVWVAMIFAAFVVTHGL